MADERTCRSIVLMEDLAAAGWTFPDPLADRVCERDAADMIEQHAFAFGVFTNGQPRFAPELQPKDYTLRCIERLGLAVDEWDTLTWLA